MAMGARHAHGNGGTACSLVAGGPGGRRGSDDGERLSAVEAGESARALQVQRLCYGT